MISTEFSTICDRYYWCPNTFAVTFLWGVVPRFWHGVMKNHVTGVHHSLIGYVGEVKVASGPILNWRATDSGTSASIDMVES